MPQPPRLVHLVRHGEVWNPDHIVYSDLPGFGLSELGQRQAAQTAMRLRERPVTQVASSPLQRAVETALPIAATHGLKVTVDDSLTEWRFAKRWSGHRWEELPDVFPGELETYLDDPTRLSVGEPIETLGLRIAEAVRKAASRTEHGDVVVVSHQDPIHAGRRMLTGGGFVSFNVGKPAHATIVSLDPAADPWTEVRSWTPPQGL